MKKFILKSTGKEVKLGDKLIRQGEIDTTLGKGYLRQEIVVNEGTLPELLKLGIIIEKCETKKEAQEVPMNLDYYLHKIAERMGWNVNRVYNHLNATDAILPSAAFSIVLREIATEFDKKYSGHIEESPEIYVVSLLNGKIAKADKSHIRNYRNFAAFRTAEDAKTACIITKDILKNLFKSGK